jgi:hypothetical protein
MHFHLIMIFLVIKRSFERDISCPDQLGVIVRIIVQDTRPVMFDEFLYLLAGTGVDDCIVLVFSSLFTTE